MGFSQGVNAGGRNHSSGIDAPRASTPTTKALGGTADCPPEKLENCYADYLKFSGQGAYFRPFGGGVFAVAARAGAISSYGEGKGVPVRLPNASSPGADRRTAPSDTDLLGIPGETVDPNTVARPHDGSGLGSCADTYPDLDRARDCDAGPRIVGGNGFLGLNAEFRFPMLGNLGGTVFYDATQVWKDPEDIRVAFEGEDGLRQGVGVGLRYMTPIGPVRGEYGWPVKARTVSFQVVDEAGNPLGPVGERKEKRSVKCRATGRSGSGQCRNRRAALTG